MLRSSRFVASFATALAVGGATAIVPATPALAADSPIYRTILQPGEDESQVMVTWRTKSKADEVLEVTGPEGTTTFHADERDFGALLYKSQFATATDLQPDTEYSYRVGSEEGGWSEPETFNTGSNGDDWSFLTVADPQIGVDLKVDDQAEQWRKTIGHAASHVPNASMIWSLGDQVEGWGAQVPQYDAYFSAPEIRHIPTNTVPGNHETYNLTMKHHDEHFSNPHQADDIRDHYFERNNVLFIGLDSNASSDADIARHEQFLREAIESRGADNDWIVVGMHHGPYSQGTHYFDKDVTNLREKLTPVLSELNVDAVLSGHDHIYTRSHLMKNNKPVLPEEKPQRGDVLEPKDGEALYLTTTTAGGGKYYDFTDVNNTKHEGARMETIDPKLAHESTAMWRQDYTEDYMRVDVSDDKLTFTTFNEGDNTLVDKVSLKKKDRDAAPADDATDPADSTESTDPDAPETPQDPEGGSSLSSSDIFGGFSSKK